MAKKRGPTPSFETKLGSAPASNKAHAIVRSFDIHASANGVYPSPLLILRGNFEDMRYRTTLIFFPITPSCRAVLPISDFTSQLIPFFSSSSKQFTCPFWAATRYNERFYESLALMSRGGFEGLLRSTQRSSTLKLTNLLSSRTVK